MYKAPQITPKIAARMTMQRLQKAGIDLQATSGNNKNIFYLASVNPSLLEAVTVDAENSTTNAERECWQEVLGWPLPVPLKGISPWGAAWTSGYDMKSLVPLIAQISQAKYPDDTMTRQHCLKMLLRVAMSSTNPATGIVDRAKLRSALVIAPTVSILRVSRSDRNLALTLETEMPDTMQFITDYFDEVLTVLPEIFRHGRFEIDIIEMLIATSPSIRDGIL